MSETPVALRARLRADLVAAMKAGRREEVSTLRTAIAALDNAEAVEAVASTGINEHVAGAEAGVGSTEAQRRALSIAELRAILRAQVAERVEEAERYDGFGRHEEADRLRRGAELLEHYVKA